MNKILFKDLKEGDKIFTNGGTAVEVLRFKEVDEKKVGVLGLLDDKFQPTTDLSFDKCGIFTDGVVDEDGDTAILCSGFFGECTSAELIEE